MERLKNLPWSKKEVGEKIFLPPIKEPEFVEFVRSVEGSAALLPLVCVAANMRSRGDTYPVCKTRELEDCGLMYQELQSDSKIASNPRAFEGCRILEGYYDLTGRLVQERASRAIAYQKTVAYFREKGLFSPEKETAEEYLEQCLADVGVNLGQEEVSAFVEKNGLQNFHHELLARVFPPNLEAMDRNDYPEIRRLVDDLYEWLKFEAIIDPVKKDPLLMVAYYAEMERVISRLMEYYLEHPLPANRGFVAGVLNFGKGEEFAPALNLGVHVAAMDLRPTPQAIGIVKESLEKYAPGVEYKIINGSESSLQEFRQEYALNGEPLSVWVKGDVDFNDEQFEIPENGVDATFSCYGGHHATDLLSWLRFMLKITRPLNDGQVPVSIIDGVNTQKHFLEQALPVIFQTGAYPNDMIVSHFRALPKEAWQLALKHVPGKWQVEEIDPVIYLPRVLQKLPKGWLPRVSQLRVAAHSL